MAINVLPGVTYSLGPLADHQPLQGILESLDLMQTDLSEFK